MKPEDITAVILTHNEEQNLPNALTSLPSGISTLVVDAQSRDRTREIAATHGARVIERPWSGFVEARTFALTQARTPWVFALDADEVIDDRLRDAILNAGDAHALDSAISIADAYLVKRNTYFCGKPLRLWRGEKLLRLFRTRAVRIEPQPAAGGNAELHERYVVDGEVKELNGTLLHFSYPDVASYQEKYERYTSIEAKGLAVDRKSLGVDAEILGVDVRHPSKKKLRLLRSVVLGWARFVWLLFGRGAILDGWRGMYVAYYSAMYPAVVVRKSFAS